MRQVVGALLAGALAAGCYNEEKYAADATEALCTLYEDCDYFAVQQFDDYEDCEEEVAADYDPATRDCEDFDRKAARECVDEIRQMDCEELYDGDFPSTCARDCGSSR